MKKHRWLALISVPVLCIIVTGVVLASSSINLPWSAVSSGGGIRGSSSYWLGDSTGQPAAGISNSSSYRLEAGFWSGATISAPQVPQAGDANGDGVVNAIDITKVERIIVGLDSPTPGADANQDSSINALDITMVERIIAGLG